MRGRKVALYKPMEQRTYFEVTHIFWQPCYCYMFTPLPLLLVTPLILLLIHLDLRDVLEAGMASGSGDSWSVAS